jgi:hypothetical protein
MRLPKNELLDYDEYSIEIIYDGKGGLDITVFDELGEEIEGLYISDSDDEEGDDITDYLDINLN